MRGPRWIDRHRRSLLLAFALLALGGAVAVRWLPVGLFPLVDFPRIVVSVDAGDRPVDRMVVEVTRPLEQALREVPDLQTIRSTSSRGSADISLSFAWGTDMVVALLQTEAIVSRAIASLPQGASFEIRRMDPTVFPVLGYSMTSDTRPLTQLRDVALYRVAPALSAVDGVAAVDVQGGRQSEYQVLLDPMRLQSMDLTAEDVARALAASNVVTAVGRLEDRHRLYLALADTRIGSLADIGHTVLRSGGQGIVELEDVGEVRVGAAPEWTRVNADGRDAVLINVRQQRGANTVQLVGDVRTKLQSVVPTLPQGIKLTPYYDQSELIVASASSVRDAIIAGAAIAGVILLLFLRNWRMTVVVSVVLPTVLLSTCVLLEALGQSLNIMTLGGMAAAVGLVVDDAVVMVEHIARRVVEHASEATGEHPPVLRYASEMWRPLTGTSAATVAVFVPLAFLGGLAGAFFRPLALTMAATLVISYGVALIVVPLLVRAFLRPDDAEALERAGPWFERVRATTDRHLGHTLRRPRLLLLPLLVLVGLGAFAYVRLGSGFMPHMDEGGFIFDYRAAPGTSLTETDRLMRQVEAIVRALPETESYSRRTGLQLGGGLTEANEGDMFIKLKSNRRRDIEAVMADLRQQVETHVPGLQIETAQLMEDLIGDLVSTPQPIEIKLFGEDDRTLRRLAGSVATQIEKVPGVVEVFDGNTIAGDAIRIHVDRVRASLEGLDPDAVTTQVGAMLGGTVGSNVQSGERLVGIRVWSPESMRERIEQVATLRLRAPGGQYLPLSRVADISIASGQPQENRDNLRQVVAVTARLEGRDLGSAMRDVQRTVGAMKLPAGYTVEYGGVYHEQRQSFRELLVVFGGALLLVATLLMFLYERTSVVLAILSTALLTVPGVLLGLWLASSELNLSSMMGLTMVVGIVTEVAVFYFAEIDTTSEIGLEDLRRAARLRLRPILMTTLIAILALLPLALGIGTGAEMQRPLAITIISGLAVALPLVLMAMPVLFLAFDRFKFRRV